MNNEVILITGSNKGLGLGTAAELLKQGAIVIITGRDEEKLSATAESLKQQGLQPDTLKLDVANESDISAAYTYIAEKYGRLDCLVNNAGIIIEQNYDLLGIPKNVVAETIENNSLGPFQLSQQLIPLLEKSTNPRIVNISSGMGALQEMGAGYPAYRMSKACMNVFTILFHNEFYESKGIRSMAICPGWVKTDMGGPDATRSLEEGIRGILWAINSDQDGPSGKFFRDGSAISW